MQLTQRKAFDEKLENENEEQLLWFEAPYAERQLEADHVTPS